VARADNPRDEAFELGLQWAHLYPESSPSRTLIEGVMNDSYLVNIVANDFKHGDVIFEPFLLDATMAGRVTTDAAAAANGVASGLINGVKAAAGSLGGLVNGVKEVVSNAAPNGNAANGVANGH
jgi:methylenetetrahydrofolate reductase (NADPH)